MRKVRKMLSDTELLRESTDRRVRMQPNGVIDETVIETIMSHIPLVLKSKHTQNTFNPKKEASKGDFQIKPKSGVDKKIKYAG